MSDQKYVFRRVRGKVIRMKVKPGDTPRKQRKRARTMAKGGQTYRHNKLKKTAGMFASVWGAGVGLNVATRIATGRFSSALGTVTSAGMIGMAGFGIAALATRPGKKKKGK